MSKKSDDSIERIFRQALTQYDTNFRESDWLKMEKMLDDEANRRAAARSKRIKGTGFALIGLTVLMVAVYFLAFKSPSDSIARLNHSETETQATDDLNDKGNVKRENPSAGLLSETDSAIHERGIPDSESETSKKEPNSGSNKNAANDSVLSGPRVTDNQDRAEKKSAKPLAPSPSMVDKRISKDRQVLTSPSTIQAPESSNNRTSSKDLAEATDKKIDKKKDVSIPQAITSPQKIDDSLQVGMINATKNPQTAPSLHQDDVANDSTSTRSGQKVNELGKIADDGDKGNVALDSSSESMQSKRHLSVQLAAPQALQEPSIQKDSIPVENLQFSETSADSAENRRANEEKKDKIKPDSRFSIAIVFAPEFSTTSLNQYSSPGESIGLRVGYQLSNRFNVNTGIIRSNKKYIGDGSDYTPRNPLYWKNRTNGIVPEEIDSRCLVYELPVGLQFDVIQTQKSRLFASTAISSYFMISQAYDYTFDAPNPGADTGWRSAGSESYWFSVGIMSVGYERYIYRSFAIGIEPYLKISLSEIGWPNVKLFSTGAYVTLRYRFRNQQK